MRSPKKFDLVLLVNVINYIPLKRHRSLVLKYCADKLRSRGYFLWVSQHGDTHYKDRLVQKIRDGYLVGAHRERVTFYREWTVSEVDKMLQVQGFALEKVFPFWKNQARLFRRVN